MVSPVVTPTPTPTRPLVARRWRYPTLALVTACIAVLAWLSIAFHDTTMGTSFDRSFLLKLYAHVGTNLGLAMLDLADPKLTTVLIVGVAVAAVLLKRWNVAAVAIAAPVVAIVVTEVILKPLVYRSLGYLGPSGPVVVPGGGSFPSGHETGLCSLTALLALLVLRAPISAAMRTLGALILAAWTVLGALGLVRNFYHYTTDTVGAILVCVACVFGIALLVDAVTPAVELRWSRRRQLT